MIPKINENGAYVGADIEMKPQKMRLLEQEGMTDDDLNLCPFCGGDVRFDKAYSYFRDSVIYCDGCDMVFTLDDCTASDDDIARAWNRRCRNG